MQRSAFEWHATRPQCRWSGQGSQARAPQLRTAIRHILPAAAQCTASGGRIRRLEAASSPAREVRVFVALAPAEELNAALLELDATGFDRDFDREVDRVGV